LSTCAVVDGTGSGVHDELAAIAGHQWMGMFVVAEAKCPAHPVTIGLVPVFGIADRHVEVDGVAPGEDGTILDINVHLGCGITHGDLLNRQADSSIWICRVKDSVVLAEL